MIVGQRVEVRFDIQSTYARDIGTVIDLVPAAGNVIVKLDKLSLAQPFGEHELAVIPDGLAPHYNPSTSCESGMRPYCTCDTCF